jgi:hypothetical protein
MGREVRLVTKDWKHPKDENGKYISLFEWSYDEDLKSYNDGMKEFIESKRGDEDSYREYAGEKPNKNHYMPRMEGDLYLMMYQNTSEGTPLSPAFKTPEELARWCTDNNVSTFGTCHYATYEEWLNMIGIGYAPSFIMGSGKLVSGVEGLKGFEEQTIIQLKNER